MTQIDPDFRVLKLSRDDSILSFESGRRLLSVHLPAPSESVLVTSMAGLLETKKTRWVSGGGIYLINQRWVPLVQRSKDSITNPGKITIASGRSNNFEDIYDPRMVIRELFEEIVLSIDDALLIPVLSNKNFLSNIDIRECVTGVVKNNSVEPIKTIEMQAYLNEKLYFDKLKIYISDGDMRETDVLFHISENGLEVNFLHAVELEINNTSKLYLRDAESVKLSNGLRMLQRLICLYDIKDKVMYQLPDGYFDNRIKLNDWELTEHANFLLEKIKENIS